jgi:hypothetical protein
MVIKMKPDWLIRVLFEQLQGGSLQDDLTQSGQSPLTGKDQGF